MLPCFRSVCGAVLYGLSFLNSSGNFCVISASVTFDVLGCEASRCFLFVKALMVIVSAPCKTCLDAWVICDCFAFCTFGTSVSRLVHPNHGGHNKSRELCSKGIQGWSQNANSSLLPRGSDLMIIESYGASAVTWRLKFGFQKRIQAEGLLKVANGL